MAVRQEVCEAPPRIARAYNSRHIRDAVKRTRPILELPFWLGVLKNSPVVPSFVGSGQPTQQATRGKLVAQPSTTRYRIRRNPLVSLRHCLPLVNIDSFVIGYAGDAFVGSFVECAKLDFGEQLFGEC